MALENLYYPNSGAVYHGLIDFDEIVEGIEVQSNCNSITFLNIGDTNAAINEIVPLPAGQNFTISWGTRITDTSTYRILFESPGGVNPKVIVMRQYLHEVQQTVM